MIHPVHSQVVHTFVVLARIPEKVCDVLAKEWMLHDLIQFLQSLRTVGDYSSPDKVWRAYSV